MKKKKKKRGELNHLGHETHASSFWREPRFISNVGLFGIFGFLFFHFIFDTNSILIAANGVSLPVFHSKEWGHARPGAHTAICSMLYSRTDIRKKKSKNKHQKTGRSSSTQCTISVYVAPLHFSHAKNNENADLHAIVWLLIAAFLNWCASRGDWNDQIACVGVSSSSPKPLPLPHTHTHTFMNDNMN